MTLSLHHPDGTVKSYHDAFGNRDFLLKIAKNLGQPDTLYVIQNNQAQILLVGFVRNLDVSVDKGKKV